MPENHDSQTFPTYLPTFLRNNKQRRASCSALRLQKRQKAASRQNHHEGCQCSLNPLGLVRQLAQGSLAGCDLVQVEPKHPGSQPQQLQQMRETRENQKRNKYVYHELCQNKTILEIGVLELFHFLGLAFLA